MKQVTIGELKSRVQQADEKLKELLKVSVRSEVGNRSGVILFVDDMKEQATIIEALLEQHGVGDVPVVSVPNVEDAQKEIQDRGEKSIKVVVVDIQLADSDGRELINWLEMKHPEIPLIVSTGHQELVGQLEREFSVTEVFVKGTTQVDEYAEALGLPRKNGNNIIPRDILL